MLEGLPNRHYSGRFGAIVEEGGVRAKPSWVCSAPLGVELSRWRQGRRRSLPEGGRSVAVPGFGCHESRPENVCLIAPEDTSEGSSSGSRGTHRPRYHSSNHMRSIIVSMIAVSIALMLSAQSDKGLTATDEHNGWQRYELHKTRDPVRYDNCTRGSRPMPKEQITRHWGSSPPRAGEQLQQQRAKGRGARKGNRS